VLAEPGFLTPRESREYMARTNNLALPFNGRSIRHMLMSWLRSLHVHVPPPDARADFLYLSVAFPLPSEDHSLAGYWADPVKAMPSMHVQRYRARVGTAFVSRYYDENRNLTCNFAENVVSYPPEVLFISGEDNRIIGPSYQREQMKYFPKARLVVVPGAGRSMFNENPGATFAAIRDYLGR
jgi:pimeloyl-ACP methyl ester carboxylesterase